MIPNNRASEPDEAADREAGAEPDTLSHPAARLAELEAALSEREDRLLRALAEQENARRRAQREREEAVKLAASDVVRDLLSTADNLRRAIESVPEEKAQDEAVQRLLEGVAATERALLDTFERHGIRRIDPLGAPFDPTHHEAVFETADTRSPAGTVAKVLQPGFLYRDRLLRPAMVAVVKGGSPAVAATEASSREPPWGREGEG